MAPPITRLLRAPIILAGKTLTYDFEGNPTYWSDILNLPWTSIIVTNASAQKIIVNYNGAGDSGLYLPAGSYKADRNTFINRIDITNLGLANTVADDIVVELKHETFNVSSDALQGIREILGV